jgi:hypothetical protein
MKMKKTTILFLIIGLVIPMFLAKAVSAQSSMDTIKTEVVTLRDKISGVEERVATAEADLQKLTKIKLSGYIQAQWQHFEAASAYPSNYFSVRRARLKIQYEPVNGVVFVLQPDFIPGNVSLKDAYVQANDRWLKTFSLWAGKFNRPNYEVEYSSSSREVPERSRVIRAIYPDERAIGAKLEINPPKIPLKVQLAIFNGNDGLSINTPNYNLTSGKWDNVNAVGQNIDFDNYKDFMGRVTYGFKFGSFGGLTIGAHGYYGQVKANSKDLLNSDYTYDQTLDNVGKGAPKQWVGFEGQLYMDILGGLALKGEYIFGVNSTPGYSVNATVVTSTSSIKNDTLTLTSLSTKYINSAPAISKNFSGYYIYLVKNLGKHHQVAVRFDYYNPNTKLSKLGVDSTGIGKASWDASKTTTDAFKQTGSAGNMITGTQSKTVSTNKLVSGVNDIAYGTWNLAYTYFFDDNIKLMIGYEIPLNRKVGADPKTDIGYVTQSYTVNGVNSSYDYSNWVKQNTLTVRLQVKF